MIYYLYWPLILICHSSQKGPAEPVVIPREPVQPKVLQPPRVNPMSKNRPQIKQSAQRSQPLANVNVKQEIIDVESPMPLMPPLARPCPPSNGSQRMQQTANTVIKREVNDLAQYVHGNGKFCYTCKKNIADAGLTAKFNNRVVNFCGAGCLPRAGSVHPPKTVAVKREIMEAAVGRGSAANRLNPAARFYCVVCDKPYNQKRSLKRHFLEVHPGLHFNEKVVAQVRSVQQA